MLWHKNNKNIKTRDKDCLLQNATYDFNFWNPYAFIFICQFQKKLPNIFGTSILFKTPSVIYFHNPFWIDFWIKTLANVLGLAHKEERKRERHPHILLQNTKCYLLLNFIQVCFDLWISHKFLTFCKGWEKMNVFLCLLVTTQLQQFAHFQFC